MILEKAIQFWYPDKDPDRAQKLISSSYMSRHLSTRNISSKSMHAFLSNLANRQTDRQTNTDKNMYLLLCRRWKYKECFCSHTLSLWFIWALFCCQLSIWSNLLTTSVTVTSMFSHLIFVDYGICLSSNKRLMLLYIADVWLHWRIVTFLIIAPYKYSYLLTYLLCSKQMWPRLRWYRFLAHLLLRL